MKKSKLTLLFTCFLSLLFICFWTGCSAPGSSSREIAGDDEKSLTGTACAVRSVTGVSVEYEVKNDWGSGFTVNVTIANKGTASVAGWTLTWTFPGNQKVTNGWNAQVTQQGQSVSVVPVEWNSTIPAGGSISFGFQATYSGANGKPADFTVTDGSTSSSSISSSSASSDVSSSSSSETSSSSSSSNPSGTFHVFLLLGQSNMAGSDAFLDEDIVKNERIQVLAYSDCSATGRVKDTWGVAFPPLHECWNKNLGPGDYFSRTILESIPEGDTIGLVPCAKSGEKIETFLKEGGTKYEWILNRAKLALEAGGVIEGILFHQGESNNSDASWPGKVKTLITDLRTDLGIGDVPFLAGELLYSGSCVGHNKQVHRLPGMLENCYIVSAEGLTMKENDQWNVHFSRDSQVIFGKRYAEVMKKALGW